MSIPQIDWQSKNIIEETKDAYLEWGFAQYTNVWNHNQVKILDDWFVVLREWFYTAKDKNDWLRDGDLTHGFVPIGGETLNPHRKKDYKEQFIFTNNNDVPECFKKDLNQMHQLITETAYNTIKIFEKILNTKNNYLVDKHLKDFHGIRTAWYPGVEGLDNQISCGEHKDYNTFTLLLSPDPYKKLQIKSKEGKWFDINYEKNSFVFNIGKLMEIWTHGYLHSATHRVMPNTIDSFMTGIFLQPDDEIVLDHIGPNDQKFPALKVKQLRKQIWSSRSRLK